MRLVEFSIFPFQPSSLLTSALSPVLWSIEPKRVQLWMNYHLPKMENLNFGNFLTRKGIHRFLVTHKYMPIKNIRPINLIENQIYQINRIYKINWIYQISHFIRILPDFSLHNWYHLITKIIWLRASSGIHPLFKSNEKHKFRQWQLEECRIM